MSDPLLIEDRGRVVTVTLNRPERLNAVTVEMLRGLTELVSEVGHSGRAGVIVLRGAGRGYCAGGDISRMEDLRDALEPAGHLITALRAAPVAVLAVIHGPAAGFGCSLALACDFSVMSRSAYFEMSFGRVGLMPDGGATALVASAVGHVRAARVLLLGERVPATAAEQWGLVTKTVDPAELERSVDQLIDSVLALSPAAFAATKSALAAASIPKLAGVLDRERRGQLELAAGSEFAEGVQAFLSKRAANFRAHTTHF